MELGKAEIAQLSRFFRDDSRLLLSSKGKLKDWLEQNFDLYHNGKGFIFSSTSKEQLRKDIELSYPRLNMRAGLFKQQDRVAVIQQTNNDKLADIKPGDQYLLVKCPAAFEVQGQSLNLPAGLSLRLAVQDINVNQFSSIIIVENLDVFDVWHKVTLPEDMPHSLIVYRGHDNATAKGLTLLLATLAPTIEVMMFADLDPKGLEIAYTTPRVNAVLAPELDDIQKILLSYSQPDTYVKQQNSVTFLTKQSPSAWQGLLDVVIKNKLAVMQQVFVALNLPLMRYK